MENVLDLAVAEEFCLQLFRLCLRWTALLGGQGIKNSGNVRFAGVAVGFCWLRVTLANEPFLPAFSGLPAASILLW